MHSLIFPAKRCVCSPYICLIYGRTLSQKRVTRERDRVGESGKNTLFSLASSTNSKFVYVHEIPLMVWVCAKALALDGNFIG